MNFEISSFTVKWNGSLSLWRQCIAELITAGKQSNILISIGIATFKKKYANAKREANNLCGDSISDIVLENDCLKTNASVTPGCGLKEFIHPELIFFTNNSCKTQNALQKVSEILSLTQADNLAAGELTNVFMIDDNYRVCESATNNGFNGICVGNISKLAPRLQDATVADVFKTIYQTLNLQPSPFLLHLAAKLHQSTRNVNTLFAPKKSLAFQNAIDRIPDELITSLDDDENVNQTTLTSP